MFHKRSLAYAPNPTQTSLGRTMLSIQGAHSFVLVVDSASRNLPPCTQMSFSPGQGQDLELQADLHKLLGSVSACQEMSF